jgi:hypothetical protein
MRNYGFRLLKLGNNYLNSGPMGWFPSLLHVAIAMSGRFNSTPTAALFSIH